MSGDALNFAKRTGVMDQCLKLVDECLGDYDLNGWVNDTWI
jgi:4-hydroxyphenylacetate 3-monooxygenase